VRVNGSVLLQNYDISAKAPFPAVVDETRQITVTNGVVNIEFIGVVNRGAVSAIALEPVTVALPPITVSPTSGSLKAGQTLQFTASSGPVTWSVSGTSTATGTVNSTGLYTAPAYVAAPSTVTVRATSTTDQSRYATAQVSLASAVGLAVSPSTATAFGGATIQFLASVSGTADTSVQWSATAGSVSSAGLWTAPSVSSTTSAVVTAKCNADSSVQAQATVQVSPVSAGTGAYVESAGLLVMEAEKGTRVSASGQSWVVRTANAGFSGTSYLSAEPNSGVNMASGYVGKTPEVRLNARFTTPGTYYVWVRGLARSFADDSVHVGLNGKAAPSAEGLSEFPVAQGTWGWSSHKMDKVVRTTLSIPSAGYHTINVWMREDGFALDKLILSNSSSFTPGGTGPTESVTEGSSPAPAPQPTISVSPSTLSFSGLVGATIGGQSFQITTSTSSMAWTATKTKSWLTLSPSSGTGSRTITVNVSLAGLAAGTHTDNIVISASGVSARTVGVTLQLTAPTPAPPPPPPTSGNQFHVSPNGSSAGDGSSARPWDLVTALNHPSAVRPGDTIWLHGGTYGNSQNEYSSRLAGTQAAPIRVRQYPGERATINGGLAIHGPYTWFWGFEIMRNPRKDGADCIDTYTGSHGTRLINLIVHDCGSNGIGYWSATGNSEIYGTLIYYNGFQTDARGAGHGIYLQNDNVTGGKTIADNIIFKGHNLGIQAYGSENSYLKNVRMEGNIVFEPGVVQQSGQRVDGILVTVGSGSQDIVVEKNFLYNKPTANDGYSRLGWQWSPHEKNIIAKENYFIGGESSLELWNWNSAQFLNNTVYSLNSRIFTLSHFADQPLSNYSISGNTYYGSGSFGYNGSSRSFSGMQALGIEQGSRFVAGAPTGVWSFVRPNKYEPGRGHVVIYNWAMQNTVTVNASSVLAVGDSYEVRDAQNYFAAPVASGVYSGSLSIPMTRTSVASPSGTLPTAPAHTGPQFGAFVIIKR
jgi:hypothetical protein